MKTKGELKYMPSGFPEDLEPPPQPFADVESFQYKAIRHKTMENELDGHKTAGTCEAPPPPQGCKPVSLK